MSGPVTSTAGAPEANDSDGVSDPYDHRLSDGGSAQPPPTQPRGL